MTYFFHLGTNTALSLAELFSVLPLANKGSFVAKDLFLVDLDQALDATALMARLGGTIKIAQVLAQGIPLYSPEMLKVITESFEPGEGKFKFGISNHAKFASPAKDKRLALGIKNFLKEKGISCRWVISKEPILSSVIVEQNLMRNGAEIVIAGDYKKSFVARTLAVQPWKELSFRDYGRPSRDDHSGMLPPKLALLMLNLAGAKKDEPILDPFCGSGTVLGEAIVLGQTHVYGSDISAKAVEDSRANIAWLEKKYPSVSRIVEISELDARLLHKTHKPASIKAIITEPYLGPQRGQVDPVKWKRELDGLYTASLRSFQSVLTRDGRVVMIWPIRIEAGKQIFLAPDTRGYRHVSLLPAGFEAETRRHLSKRNTIIYGREGQKVWREIIVLEKE